MLRDSNNESLIRRGNGRSNGNGSARETSVFGSPGHGSYKWWVLANVMIGTAMVVLDATIVNVALPKIMAAFGITIDTAEWVLNGYLIAFSVMLSTSAWFADHFGHKKIYMLSLIIFTTGSFLCGIAWNESVLIFFRVLQGMGGGFLMPVGMAIVLREFPREQRGTALGFWSVASAGSVSLGPLVGGYLVDRFDWSSIFFVNVPIGILGIFATWLILKEHKTEKSRSFDVLGFLSMTIFTVSLLLALADGNADWNTGGWTSTFILTNFAISIVALAVFLVREFTARHPLIELRLFKSFNYSMSNIIRFIFGLSVFGSTFLLPLYLQTSLGYTAYQAGAIYLPTGLIQGVAAPISGILTDRINPKIITFVGIVVLGWSWYLNGFLSLFSMHAQVMLPMYLRGIGMGLMFTPLTALGLKDIKGKDMTQASGLFNVVRQVGGAFGVALIGTIFTERTTFHTAIDSQVVSQYSSTYKNILDGIKNFATYAVAGPIPTELQRAKALIISNVTKQAIVQATDDTFLFACAIMLLCIIPILLLKTPKKNAARTSKHSGRQARRSAEPTLKQVENG